MIDQRIEAEINKQIKLELGSAYLYLSMAAYFYNEGWDGMAHWMEAQAKEEFQHAMKFFNHLVERGGKIELQALEKPQSEWKSPLDAFKAAYQHEKFITGRIHEMMDAAIEEKDYAAQILLQWFVEEQVEEEDSTLKVVEALERIGDRPSAMFMLDAKLGKRE